MSEIFPIFGVIVGGGVLAFLYLRKFTRAESSLLALSFVGHLVAAFAQVWITREVYGGGDMLNYNLYGQMIAQGLRTDFARIAPEALNLLLQRESHLPFPVLGPGESTGTMCALAGWLSYFLGDDIYPLGFFTAIAAYFGKVALYEFFRDVFPPRLHIRLLVAATLIPSVVYWSSGLGKEPIVMAALGWLLLSLQRLRGGYRPQYLIVSAVSAITIALVKPYILFAVVIAIGAWVYWRRSVTPSGQVRIRPLYVLLGAVIAVGGLVFLNQRFPRYALDTLAEETARMQQGGAMVGGGSYMNLGNASQRTIAGQLAFAPIALISALFRPFIFEVRNPLMLVNAFETTTVAVLVIRSIVGRSWGWMWRTLINSPNLMFCLVFAMTLGVGVGLASSNLGTLSRYRMPLVPFIAALALVWTARPALPSGRSLNPGRQPRRRRRGPASLEEAE